LKGKRSKDLPKKEKEANIEKGKEEETLITLKRFPLPSRG